GAGATARLTPRWGWAGGTTYWAPIAGTVTDTNGVALGSTATWSFSTAAAPPVIVSQSPASGATGVSTSTTVSATFNRAMAGATLDRTSVAQETAGSPSRGAATNNASVSTAPL